MHFDFTMEEIQKRGGVLDKFMDTAFDAAIIVDINGIIIHNSKGSERLINEPEFVAAGNHIDTIDPHSPFEKVIRSGKAETGAMVLLRGRNCMTNVIPIISKGEVIGALGMILFRSMTSLNRILASLAENKSSAEAEDYYDTIARIESNYTFGDYVGRSLIITELLDQCKRAADTIYPILFIGETGTGKEILANAVHSQQSSEKLTPFIKINCTAIPRDLLESELFGYEKGAFTGASETKKGKFELAAGGTILLDEIGDMDLQLQGKLLRVLEEKEYERIGGIKLIPLNARIIASTNRNLKNLCHQGKFRPDLYYRLSTIEIKVPPLRRRSEDIPLLVDHFVEQDNLNLNLSDGAMQMLKQYQWPGNARELRNIVNRLSINNPTKQIKANDIMGLVEDDLEDNWENSTNPLVGPQPVYSTEDRSLAKQERETILETLEKNSYNISQTAIQLKICRTTLYNKIKKYNFKLNKTLYSS